MATATLILLMLSMGIQAIQAFGSDQGPFRVGGAIGAFCYGGCAWWLYFNSGLFG